jgi:NAD(P)-dependent dehydrogenase (short-subunit alcohol dehydrogenase family)
MRLLETSPQRVLGGGERLAVFLASADADYVTGSTYFMDGGLMRNMGQGA